MRNKSRWSRDTGGSGDGMERMAKDLDVMRRTPVSRTWVIDMMNWSPNAFALKQPLTRS